MNVRGQRAAAHSPEPPPRWIPLGILPPEPAAMVCIAGFGESEAVRAAAKESSVRIPVPPAIRAARRALVPADPHAARLLRGDRVL